MSPDITDLSKYADEDAFGPRARVWIKSYSRSGHIKAINEVIKIVEKYATVLNRWDGGNVGYLDVSNSPDEMINEVSQHSDVENVYRMHN